MKFLNILILLTWITIGVTDNTQAMNGLRLSLNRCRRITDAGLVYLKDLTNLKVLNLTSCRCIGAGLVYLKNLTNLQELNLTFYSQITDANLIHLAKLTNLRTLNLTWCDEITDTGIQNLKNSLPQVEIIRSI